MSILSKIGSYIKISLFSSPQRPELLDPLEIQVEKITNTSKKICKICFLRKYLDELQTLPHKDNQNCKANNKSIICIECVSRIQKKICPFCRQSLSMPITINQPVPMRNWCVTLFRRFTYLDPVDGLPPASLDERVASAFCNCMISGVYLTACGVLVILGDAISHNYGYDGINKDSLDTIVWTFLEAGWPLGAIYGFARSSIIPSPTNDGGIEYGRVFRGFFDLHHS